MMAPSSRPVSSLERRTTRSLGLARRTRHRDDRGTADTIRAGLRTWLDTQSEGDAADRVGGQGADGPRARHVEVDGPDAFYGSWACCGPRSWRWPGALATVHSSWAEMVSIHAWSPRASGEDSAILEVRVIRRASQPCLHALTVLGDPVRGVPRRWCGS